MPPGFWLTWPPWWNAPGRSRTRGNRERGTITPLIGTTLSDFILSFYRWEDMAGDFYARKSKLETCLGPDIWEQTRGKIVLDFGCGDGAEAVEVAERGHPARLIALDIDQELLARGRALATQKNVVIEFTDRYDGQAELIYMLDSFEHFSDPALILRLIARLLTPRGVCRVSFGPTWYHPLGSHCLIFPWSHLILSERSVMKWRDNVKHDGLARYADGSGGCNGITIKKFIELVEASDLKFSHFELVPIRKLKWLHNRFTREFTTAVIRCSLVHKS